MKNGRFDRFVKLRRGSIVIWLELIDLVSSRMVESGTSDNGEFDTLSISYRNIYDA